MQSKQIYSTQSNTLAGFLILAALASNCQTEGLLCKLGSTGLADIAAGSDLGYGVILERQTSTATVFPLVLGSENVRIRLKGTCNQGDLLIMATGGDAGKVITVGSSTGKLFCVGVAEEAGVDGQLVLVRPMPGYLTGAAGAVAFSGAAPAATAATNTTPYGFSQVQADAIKQNVIDIRAALIAHGIMA